MIANIHQANPKHFQEESLDSCIDNTNLDKVVETAFFPIDSQTQSNTIKPHGTITSGMVLQRRCVNCLTGTTTDSKIVAVWKGKTYAGTITDGKFSIYLPPAEAGGPYTLTFYSERSKITLTDIYVGEVFLCAGQSNMQFSVAQAQSGTGKAYEAVGDRVVQAYIVPLGISSEPKSDAAGFWASASRSFPAVGYLFGLHMYNALGVPIGLVRAATSGTFLSYWLPKEAYDDLCAGQYMYYVPDRPVCAGYNAIVAPLLNMRFRGVVWYQGEANAKYATYYNIELKYLINTYRKVFNNPNMTFTVIELPKFEQNPDGWAHIRKHQQQVAATVENVCLSVSIDQGDMKDIHPADKTVIAKRAAQSTLQAFFGLDCPIPPAVVKAEKTASNQVVLTLKNADGLVARNGANGFQFSTNGSAFFRVSDVTVNGNTITVTAEDEIQILRYGWTISCRDESVYNDPSKQVTIYNGDGLPMDQGYWDFRK